MSSGHGKPSAIPEHERQREETTTATLSKLPNYSSQISKLWVPLRIPAAKLKVGSNQGRHTVATTCGMHVHSYTHAPGSVRDSVLKNKPKRDSVLNSKPKSNWGRYLTETSTLHAHVHTCKQINKFNINLEVVMHACNSSKEVVGDRRPEYQVILNI